MTLPAASRRWRPGDPRLYQIATLALLLAYGLFFLNFDITVAGVVVLLATVIVTQAVCDHVAMPTVRLKPDAKHWAVNIRSALISGLSLCLLLRTNRPELAVLAAVLTIAGKFLIRFRGKHLFNPTNGGLVAMLLLTDQVWVSPGQWGSAVLFLFLMASVGTVVVMRVSRSDVTYAFILFYGAMLFGRALYLGEPLAIPLHRLHSGPLLRFTFFVIVDPNATPDST